MSHRFLCALALTLTVVPVALACSAAGDNGSENKNTGSTSNGSTSNNGAGTTGLNIGGTSGLNLAGGAAVGGSTTGTACGQTLPVIYRDFNAYGMPGGHDDFEASARGVKNSDGSIFKGWNDIGCGLVEPTLGANGKPKAFTGMADVKEGVTLPGLVGRQQRTVSGPGCWTAANPTPMGVCSIGTCGQWTITPASYAIKSAATFDQWYTTVEGVNKEIQADLPLTLDASGKSIYDTNKFFPIDGKGFQTAVGADHNYHFTTEIHVKFKYEPGQVFTFRGDDDLWIFVNNQLALDVGGQHQALEGTVNFDSLGLTAGSSYPMDIFHAERQTAESNFRIETNIKCFEPVVK